MAENAWSDEEIIRSFRVAEKRERAFTHLVKNYQQRLYWVIRRMVIVHDDADDVLQNVFMKVWMNLDNFRQDAGLFTWLYRIAINETLTFIEQKKRKLTSPMESVETYLSDHLTTSKDFTGDEIELKLQQAMIRLPEKQRIVFQLRYYDEMPYEEMSEVLETSPGALKASFHHAVKKVEEYVLNH